MQNLFVVDSRLNFGLGIEIEKDWNRWAKNSV